MNNDGLPDLVVASARADWSGTSIAFYPARSPHLSNSNATAWLGRSTFPTAIAAGDLDGDGVQDLVLLNASADSFDYVPSFTGAVRSVSLGYVPNELFVADFNGDYLSDVVTTMQGGPLITVVLGNASFPGQAIQLVCGGDVMDVALGDFNHDSLLDIVAVTDSGNLDFFFNSGQQLPFGAPLEIPVTPGAGIWSVAAGDFNSDGLTDVAYTRSIRKVTIMYQQLNEQFSTSSPSFNLSHSTGSDFTAIWSGDVTGDGKDDIVAMRPSDPAMYLFDQSTWSTAPHPYGTLTLPEMPKFVSVLDATDRGRADVVAIFNSADLLFLYRQSNGSLPSTPSMVFVTGADPNYATIGDGTHDNRGDLLVSEPGSHSVSIWQQINFPPTAHAGGPYRVEQGTSLQLNGSASTGTSEIPYMEYDWDFGDGNVTGWVRQARPTHTYIEVGNYTVNLQVRDPAGLMSSDSASVNVTDAVPHVDFTWNPLNPNEGQTVNFTDLTHSFDPVVSTVWIVDGVPSGSEHTLTLEFQNGTHEVTLEVTDSDGSVRNKTYTIVVQSMPPDVRIDAPASALEGAPVPFLALVDEWHGGPVDPIVSYEWDYSYVPDMFVPDPYAPNSNYSTHIFSADAYPDYYRIAVRVTDIDGMVSVATWDIAIFDVGPTAGFVLNTSDPQEGVPFRFISTTSSFDGIVDWNWTLRYPDNHTVSLDINDSEMASRSFADLQDGNYTMLLTVKEADGNTSSYSMSFHVREIPPFVSFTTVPFEGWDGYYEEFYDIVFVANVTGLDPAVKYEWDYSAPGAEFQADSVTTANSSVHAYLQVGNYTAKVRVTDSDGSVATQPLSVEIRHKPFRGDFGLLVKFSRDFGNTSNVTFDLSPLLAQYPDVVRAVYDLGDGTVFTVDRDLLLTPVNHSYALGRDYHVNITVTDDDGYSFLLDAIVGNRPPVIQLLSPTGELVIRSGTPLLFLITPGSAAIYGASYHFDGGGPMPFTQMYQLNTSGWSEGPHSVLVVAADFAGSVSRLAIRVTIDDITPGAVLYSSRPELFGGGRVNITIKVDDPNVVASGIVLYVRFQGESAFSTFSVARYDSRTFYRVLDLPVKEGNITFYADVSDLAGNSVRTPLYSSAVKLHFMTVAWPYLLTAAVLASLGTAGYFMREGRIAVDETFVVYRDGRLISHSTRRLKPGMDDQVLGSMFVAIQDFVKDSFKDVTSFTLRRLDFGEKSIVIEKGDHMYLAAVLHGVASRKIASRMKMIVEEIEDVFGEHLKDWDGDFEKMRGVNEIVKKLYSRMPMLPGSSRKGS
jgi:PKD repeat protein